MRSLLLLQYKYLNIKNRGSSQSSPWSQSGPPRIKTRYYTRLIESIWGRLMQVTPLCLMSAWAIAMTSISQRVYRLINFISARPRHSHRIGRHTLPIRKTSAIQCYNI